MEEGGHRVRRRGRARRSAAGLNDADECKRRQERVTKANSHVEDEGGGHGEYVESSKSEKGGGG